MTVSQFPILHYFWSFSLSEIANNRCLNSSQVKNSNWFQKKLDCILASVWHLWKHKHMQGLHFQLHSKIIVKKNLMAKFWNYLFSGGEKTLQNVQKFLIGNLSCCLTALNVKYVWKLECRPCCLFVKGIAFDLIIPLSVAFKFSNTQFWRHLTLARDSLVYVWFGFSLGVFSSSWAQAYGLILC